MVRFCLNSIGRKRYFGQTDILLVASEKYRQLPYKNILRVRGNDERFTRLLPPPEGSGFPPMANERILFMKPRSEVSMQLYKLMLERDYPEEFCDIITRNLNTDFTAQRMIGYLYHYEHPPVAEIADEMLSILADRNRIMQKKELEEVNAKWNDFLMNGFNDDDN